MVKAAEEGQTSRLVLRSIFFCHWPRLLAALCLQLFYSGLQFAGPLFLNQIVKFITNPPALQTVRRRAGVEASLYSKPMASSCGAHCRRLCLECVIPLPVLYPTHPPFPPPACHPSFSCQDYGLTKSYIFAAMMFVGPVLGTIAAGQANRLSVGTQVGWRWWLVGEGCSPTPAYICSAAGRSAGA